MSGFQSKRQASKSLLEPQSAKEVANEQSWDTGLWFVATTASEAHLQAALRRLTVAVEGTHPDPWREAIDNALICTHIGTVDSFPTADQALEALIDWHVAVALDPEVSSAAQALVDRGAAQPQAEPVAYGIRSKRDGSFLEHVAIVGWVTFDQRMAALRSEPWVKAGAAEIVPLYAAPQAAVAEPVAWRRYNRSIGWQYEDGVTSFASDPSAEPLYAAPQAVAEPLSAEQEKYAELLYAVGSKWPGETRHQTALRYILQAEQACQPKPAKQAHGIGIKGSAA